jgi:hypothetical protein
MKECNPRSMSSATGSLIYQTNVLTPQPIKGSFKVIHFVGDVVDTFPVLFQEPGHRRIRRCRLKKLDATLSHGKKGDLDLLLSDDLGPLKFHPHDITIERNMAIDAVHGDADMVDFPGHRTPAVGNLYLLSDAYLFRNEVNVPF